jgi:phytoene synthase
MSAGGPSKDSAAFCADLVRTHDFARYASTLFLPAIQRRALLAVYAFNVEISRVRDQVSQPLPGEIRMQWWTDMLDGAGHGEVEGNPVAVELLQVIGDFRLPVAPLSRLIEEHQFDLYNDPMPSMAALEGYVTDTSSALFLLGARIAAPPSEATDHLARHAGLAQGMAQVIAALPLDAARRQLFLPLQLLQQHGSGIEEVFSGKQTQGTRAAIDQLIGEARKHLATASDLLAHVPPQARPVFLPLALVRRDLQRLSRADADPFVPQATSRFGTLWTLWRASRSREFGG